MTEAIQNTIPETEEIEVRSTIEAKWQFEQRKRIMDDRDELVAYYEDQIAKVKADADYKIGFIDRALFAFFQTVEHKKTKTQESWSIPAGKLMLKKQAPEFKRDEKTVIDWLKQNGGTDYVKTVESLDWANLKKDSTVVGSSIVNSDGEIIPGVEVIEREDKFVVEV